MHGSRQAIQQRLLHGRSTVSQPTAHKSQRIVHLLTAEAHNIHLSCVRTRQRVYHGTALWTLIMLNSLAAEGVQHGADADVTWAAGTMHRQLLLVH